MDYKIFKVDFLGKKFKSGLYSNDEDQKSLKIKKKYIFFAFFHAIIALSSKRRKLYSEETQRLPIARTNMPLQSLLNNFEI